MHFQPSPFEDEISAQQIGNQEKSSFVEKCLLHGVDSPGGANAAPLQLHIKLHSQPSNEREFRNVIESKAKIDAKKTTIEAQVSGDGDLASRKDPDVAQTSPSRRLQLISSTAQFQNNIGMLEIEDDNDNISAFERLDRLGSDKYSDSSRTATDPDLSKVPGRVHAQDISSTLSTTSDTPLAEIGAADPDAETEIDWTVQPPMQRTG